MENFKYENLGTDEGIREIIGFLHHKISQQEKDIALLNRRVAELIQNSKSSDQSTIQAFMEASNCRLDSFSASIQSLTDQMVRFTVPTQLHLANKSKESINEVKSEIKEEISQINIEIESLKNQIIRLNLEKEKNLNSINQSEINNQNEQDNTRPKTSKKSKSKKTKLDTISIFDIKPNQNTHNTSRQHHQTSLNKQQTEIDSLTSEINQIKKKLTSQNDISNQKFLSVNKRIDDLETKIKNIHTNPIQKKVEIDFTTKKEIQNKIENISEKVYHEICNNEPSYEIKNIASSDSLDYVQIPDLEMKTKINRKSSLNSINFNDNEMSKSFASTAKINCAVKNGSPSKLTQNATPRKTTAHYTLINGDCLKRPGSQMIQKRSPYKNGQQKFPL